MVYPLDRRESIIVEFALRYLDDNLDAGVDEPLDDVLNDNGLLSLGDNELEELADGIKP
ncbi:hypothetical protein LCGC14_0964380 [marine sediment metagenome]|uniref:Uncharacterized protein n=1 Tax=marine sediment metagenome TaxID=412755 RepID=A0A0F9NZK8_9ZZZZ